MNSTSVGEYVTVGGFNQKIAPGTTVIHSKQANRRQQVIQPAKTAKDNSRRHYAEAWAKWPRKWAGQPSP